MANKTMLEKYQLMFSGLAARQASIPPDQIWAYQELLYRMEVLQVCQMFTLTAPIGTDMRSMLTHYQMMDGYVENLKTERRFGSPADADIKKQRETARQNLCAVIADYRKRFSSFSASAPEAYKTEIVKTILIAVDHGNYAMKTPNFSFTSALMELSGKATIHETDVVEYKGRAWTLSHDRIRYMRDKTQDERFFILTLFAISKELERMGAQSSVEEINLAVGLPPEHYSTLRDRLKTYIQRGRVSFVYNDKPVCVVIQNVFVFPQAFAAITPHAQYMGGFSLYRSQDDILAKNTPNIYLWHGYCYFAFLIIYFRLDTISMFGGDTMGVDYMLLGQNIRKYRRMADLTQEQLAELTGYSDGHIGQIENAYGIPSYEALVRIADALNITMDQLSYGNIRNTDGYFVQELVRLTDGFDDKEKRFVIDVMLSVMEQMRKHMKGDQK